MAKNENMALAPQGAALPTKFNPAADAGAGLPDRRSDPDIYVIPHLILLQDLSPQCKKTEAAYVAGAEAGLFFNTATRRPLGKEVYVAPCAIQRRFAHLTTNKQDAEFLGIYVPTDPLVGKGISDKGFLRLPDGTFLQDWRYHLILLLRKDEEPCGCVLKLKSTMIPISRAWMEAMANQERTAPDGGKYVLPSYGAVYKLTVDVHRKNKNSWYGVKPEFFKDLDINSEKDAAIYQAAKRFGSAVQSGTAEIATEEQEN